MFFVFRKRKQEKNSIKKEPTVHIIGTDIVLQATIIKERMFYDETWEIQTTDGSTILITRSYVNEEYRSNFLSLLKNCTTIDDVKSLDEKQKIYYD